MVVMVKRQRRMTKKKSAVKKSAKRTTKAPKGKAGLAKKRSAVRGTTKTDRANKATAKLMKSIQKKRSQE